MRSWPALAPPLTIHRLVPKICQPKPVGLGPPNKLPLSLEAIRELLRMTRQNDAIYKLRGQQFEESRRELFWIKTRVVVVLVVVVVVGAVEKNK